MKTSFWNNAAEAAIHPVIYGTGREILLIPNKKIPPDPFLSLNYNNNNNKKPFILDKHTGDVFEI